MAVTLNASTSSGFIATSDTSGVLQLQANGVTKATVSSSGFSYPGAVLQVISATYSTQLDTSSTTYVDTGLSVSITPTSSTSKILVIASLLGTGKNAANDIAKFRLVRGSTEICQVHDCFYTNDTAPNFSPVTFHTLDSPATTSSTTYKAQIASGAGSTVTFNANNRSNSTITVMEIAA